MNVKRNIKPIHLASFPPYQISLLADQLARKNAAIAKSHNGLNLSQWRVLAAIAEAPGRTANEVVAVTPMDKGIVSRAVKNLLELQLIERKISNNDGRLGHLFLTEKGLSQYQSMAKQIRVLEKQLMAVLTDQEKAIFLTTLEKLNEKAKLL